MWIGKREIQRRTNMNKLRSKLFVIGIIGAIVLAGCVQTTPAPTGQPVVIPPTQEPTLVLPTLEPTIAPTETPMPTATPTEEPTVAVTVAIAVTETTTVNAPENTPEAPAVSSGTTSAQVTAKESTNCRKYPMRNSNSLGYLEANKTVDVHGKDVSSEWFYISNPTNPGQRFCWVWAGSLTLNGEISAIEVISSSVND
jgi:hypothetical protein